MKTDLRKEAFRLRKMNGSYNFLSKKLGVSKSTLSLWFKSEGWSSSIKEKLTNKNSFRNKERLKRMNDKRRMNLERLYVDADNEAIEEFSALKNNPLFITAISLYWGEGDKIFKNGQVRVSNIDWKMLDIFKRFLQNICSVPEEKLRGEILLYPDLDPDECLNFWSSHVNLPKQNFFKPVLIKGRPGKRRTTHYGIGIIQVSDKALKKKILKWVELTSDILRC